MSSDRSDSARGPSEALRSAAVLMQALGLALVLSVFRVEKVLTLGLDPGLLGSMALLLPDLAFLALAAAGWLLLSRALRSAAARLFWWGLFGAVHLSLYLLAVGEQGFFLHSGIRLHGSVLGYALENLDMLSGLLGTGIDLGFWLRLGFALAVFLGAFALARQRTRSGSGAASSLGQVGALGVGALAVFLLPTPAALELAGLDRGLVEELLRPIPDLEDLLERVPPEALTEELYRAPVLEGQARRRPNLVLVILESTGAGAVPLYPNAARVAEPPPQPALHALGEQGWVYETAYASVTHTSKALVGLLCGMAPRLEMEIWESLQDNLPLVCLPRLLHDLGYRTAFLQTALGAFENRPGLVKNLGFGSAAYQRALARPGFAPTGYLGLDEMAMVDPALAWVANAGEMPFFLTLLTVSPHHPYETPGEPAGALGDLGTDREEARRRYHRTLEHQDAFLAAVKEGLDRLGHGEDTLWMVVGDHGEAFGEHLAMQHDLVPYEEVVRVPLVLYGPQLLGEPRRVDGLRHHYDLLPTVLDLLDAPWQGRLPGKSLLGPGHEAVTSSCWYTNSCFAHRRGARKVVYHYGLRPTEVFDLARDPAEKNNLAPTLGRDEVRRLEDEVLVARGRIEAFWEKHPPEPGPELWWAPPAPGRP